MVHRSYLKFNAKMRMLRPGFKVFGYTGFVLAVSLILSFILQLSLPALEIDAELFNSLATVAERAEYLKEIYANYEIPLYVFAIAAVFVLFLSVLRVGYLRVCLMMSRNEKVTFSEMFDGFSYCLKIIGAKIISAVLSLSGPALIVLGSFLSFKYEGTVFFYTVLAGYALILPNIIFALQYSQTYLVMIDNPDMNIFQAMRRSRQLMHGRKWEYLVFELSFLPWLLSSLLVRLFELWTDPYMQVSICLYYQYICGYEDYSIAGVEEKMMKYRQSASSFGPYDPFGTGMFGRDGRTSEDESNEVQSEEKPEDKPEDTSGGEGGAK